MGELKEYMKTARIYYKVVGSNKVHTITPLTYSFFKGKVFDLEKLSSHSYYVKDNISFIHFYKSIGENIDCDTYYIRTTNPNTRVLITMDDKESYNFKVYAEDVTIKNEKDDKVIFSAEIKDAYKVKYRKEDSFTVEDAKETILQGNPGTLYLTIESSSLKVNDLSDKLVDFTHSGDEIKLNNVNCNLFEFETDAENIGVQNSNIKNSYCSFKNCVKPVLVNSTWKIETPLNYLDGTIGNEEVGITITDATFSDKASLELARAYATYGLRQFLNNVKDVNALDISPKLEVIDKRKRALKDEYDRQIASLEAAKDEIMNDSENNIVNTLVKKRKLKL